MATPLTRQKIKDAAVRCFNREGMANVRLQHIADEAFVSIGNMTYHYRNKEAIVEAVWEQLVQKQQALLAAFRVLPLFEDIERLLRSCFELQQEYRFFYLDTLELMRAFPDIQQAHNRHIQWQVQQMEAAMAFNQARGAFMPPQWPHQFSELAHQFWMTADLWLYRQTVQQASAADYPPFRERLWALFRPLFTDMGQREFEQLSSEERLLG